MINPVTATERAHPCLVLIKTVSAVSLPIPLTRTRMRDSDARVAIGAYRWVGEGGRDPLGVLVGDTLPAPFQLGTSFLEGGVALDFGTPV